MALVEQISNVLEISWKIVNITIIVNCKSMAASPLKVS